MTHGSKKSNLLLGIGMGVLVSLCTSESEFKTVTFELSTVRDRMPRTGVLVQEVNLFER